MLREREDLYGRQITGRRAFLKRATYSIALVLAVLIIGTIGFHYIEHYSYIDSFYFISMLATAQGPATTPATSLGKIFASIMAFVSVGSVVFALGFIFGPFFGRLFRMGAMDLEKDEHAISKDVKRLEKKLK